MTLTTLLIANAIPAVLVIYALLHLLTDGIHADRRHRAARADEILSLPVHQRDRIAA